MTEPYYADESASIYHGDCLGVLDSLDDRSIDAVVCDPPYNLSFMGRGWDTHESPLAFQQWCEMWTVEAFRVLKPGGHILAFGGTRTWHRLAVAVEDAGFEIRDSIAWLYGSGFPKSLDVSKAIDKAAGATREIVGTKLGQPGYHLNPYEAAGEAFGSGVNGRTAEERLAASQVTAPATPEAEQWQGWGTALKPAFEPVVVGRKPLTGTVAGNVLAHGTGALNIDATRIGTTDKLGGGAEKITTAAQKGDEGWTRPWMSDPGAQEAHASRVRDNVAKAETLGRWPANVVLDESQAAALDEQSGFMRDGTHVGRNQGEERAKRTAYSSMGNDKRDVGYGGGGGASRFFKVAVDDESSEADRLRAQVGELDLRIAAARGRLQSVARDTSLARDLRAALGEDSSDIAETFKYCAKAPKKERPVVIDADGKSHSHATVKPLALMRWLVRLVTPPGGVVLDPFAGSGTTVEAALLEGFRVIGIERETDYLPMIQQRIDRARAVPAVIPEPDLFAEESA